MELNLVNNVNMAIALTILVHIWFTILLRYVEPQVVWTPIYIDGNSQVDLWTKASHGCTCPWDEEGALAGRKDCACCVQHGGCHCGQEAPNRCSQCGLEHYCSSMCNLTIDSNTLVAKSGKTFGQIKSPSIEGPSSCWYTLRPALDQRVELQVYRLVNVGRFNVSRCDGGFLEWQSNDSETSSNQLIRICGANERYSPPVVMYSDTNNTATLFFQIHEKTLRSQFLAYFSFTPKNSTQGVGFQAKGGTQIPNTGCDWKYEDVNCIENKCTLTSPGYPGMYPPNRQCKYHLTTSSTNTRIQISFTAVLLPHNHCLTDYIAIYQGSTVSDLLLTTICGSRHPKLEYTGPDLLIVFSSGPQVPPYNYNGFVATVEFLEQNIITELFSVSTIDFAYSSIDYNENTVLGTVPTAVLVPKSDCDISISGNNSRSGHFDTRDKDYHPYCRIVFRGSPTDVIHLSIFNYRLKAPACRSMIEIFDGIMEHGAKPIRKFCSPIVKMARESHGKLNEQQTFISKGNMFSIVLKRTAAPASTSHDDIDFVDGAYVFHDEQIGGTLQPSRMCDVHYYGMSSPSVGTIDNPVDQHLFWNLNGQLKCVQQFIPAANQSITITIRTLGQMKGRENTQCQTQCGDNGCQCVADTTPLEHIDHLLLRAMHGQTLSCLCGNFQAEWLPVIVRSWSPVQVIYSVAQYNWNNKGYSFSAVYSFISDGECGRHTFNNLVGEIDSKNLTSNGHFNNFYHLNCVWIFDASVQRQLIVEVQSAQNRPCTAWNISIHEYSTNLEMANIGELLHTFCPRDKLKVYSLPWKLSTAIIRLRALTRRQPQFTIKWRSQMVRTTNTRLANPTPAPNNAVSNGATSLIYMCKNYITTVIYVLYIIDAIYLHCWLCSNK